MRFTLVGCFLLAAMLAPGVQDPAFAAPETVRKVGLVTFRVGDVDLVRKDRSRKVKVRELIEEKDVIKTGPKSRVVVQFSEGAFIAIQENTEVAVNKIRRTSSRLEFFVNLVKGQLGVDAREGERYDIRIQGPTAVALVRGTTFLVEAEGMNTRVIVGEGEVEVQGPGTAKLSVRSGEKVLAEPGPGNTVGLQKNMVTEFEKNRLRMLEEFRASKARNFDHLIQQIERNKNLMPR